MFHGMAHWSLEKIKHTFYAFLHPLRLLRLMCQGVRRCQEPGLVRFSKNFFVVSTSTCPSEWQTSASWTNRMLPLTVWKGFKSNLRKSKSRPKPNSYYTKYNSILIIYRVTHSSIHSTWNIYLNNPEYIYKYITHVYAIHIYILYMIFIRDHVRMRSFSQPVSLRSHNSPELDVRNSASRVDIAFG